MVAIGSSVLYTALNILVAELWVFPIPFLVVAGAPVLISIWAIASRLVLGPHPVEGVQDGSFRGRRVLLLTAVHASLLAIYPAYQAVFLEVDGFLELAMFALLPVINLSLKNLQTALGSHLEDSLPEVIIFSVDVFNAIYSVLCMHSANSIKMVALTLVLNTFVLILSLHGMNRRSRVARECRSFQLMERQQQQIRRTQSVLDSVVTGGCSPALLSTLVTTTLRMLQAPGQLDTHELRTIRLLSGMPHQLSSSSSALLDSLAARSVYNNNRRTTVTTCVAQIKSRFSSAAVEGRVLSATHFPPPSPYKSMLAKRLRGTVLVVPTHVSSRTTINEIETSACQQDKRDESTSTKSEISDTQPNSAELLEIPMLQTLYLTTPHVEHVIHAMPHSIVEPIPSLPRPSGLWISLFGQEVSDKLIPLVSKNNPFIGTVLDETRKLNTRAVKQTLQLLFNNEYLGLMAYTQCIIPVVYLLYMPILQALPNHVYYPTHYRYFGGENEFDERMTVIGILAGLQFAVLMALQVFVPEKFPTRSDTQRVRSFTQVIRGLSTEPLRTLDSLAVLRQDSGRSCNGQQTSTVSPRADSKGLPRRSSYVLEIRPDSPTKRCLRQTSSLSNFRELSTTIPKPPGTIEGSPEKKNSMTGPDGSKMAASSQKRDALLVSLPPKVKRQPSLRVATTTFFGYSFAPLYDFWERLQVSHCGQYSVERMLALDEYCQRVSIGRVLVVCLLFPLGPLLVVVLTEFMPLQPVENGPLTNYVFWIRHTLMGTLIVMCGMMQAKAWIPEMAMTTKQVLAVAIGSALMYTASNVVIADLWVFPIPFFVVVGAPLMITIWAIVSRIALGPRPLEGVQDGEFQGRQFLLLIAVHASLLGLYPAYQAVFLALDGLLQLGMIALVPVINLALKNLQTSIGSHLEDSLPEVIIFSVDVFSAIYSVLCMHSANSMKMVAITMILNTSVMFLSLHGMNRRSRVARACRSFQLMEQQQEKIRRRQSVLDSVVAAGGNPALLSTLVDTMLRLLQAPGQLDTAELRAIRLRRTTEAVSVAQMKERYSSAAMEGCPLRASELPVASPSRSKLVRRLRGAALVSSTTRWLSLRIGSRARQGDSARFRSGHRESTNVSTESDESEAEKVTRQSSSLSSQGSTVVVDMESPAPRISQLIDASSLAVLSPKTHQKSSRRSIPALWQETSEKLLPLVSKNNPVIGILLKETQKQNTRAVKQTLQLLFNNEYIGLIAYAQCIIPVLYLLYMPALQALPNHVYYPTHYRYFGDALEFEERELDLFVLVITDMYKKNSEFFVANGTFWFRNNL
ncbi:hypothetical protein GQ600_25597 [Phytophthora cactorum]|nr:hypothetical protein GQ600_25597 [Phytophthora cactorum]